MGPVMAVKVIQLGRLDLHFISRDTKPTANIMNIMEEITYNAAIGPKNPMLVLLFI